jgi:RHS repeat-associated protein
MRRCRPQLLFVALLLSMFYFSVRAAAQDPPDVAAGVGPTSTYHSGDFDFVDMASARLNLHIPLFVDHSQRGELNFTYSLYFSSTSWYNTCGWPNNSYEYCYYNPALPSDQYFTPGVFFGMDGRLSAGGSCIQDQNTGDNDCVDAAAEDDGTVHPMGTLTYDQYYTPITEESIDGSGIRGDSYGYTNKDGVHFVDNGTAGASITDANGNEITFQNPTGPQYMTDTLGRVWTTTLGNSDVSGCPVYATSSNIWMTPGPNGTTRQFKFCFSPVSVQTNLPPYPGTTAQRQWGPANEALLTGVVLPDNTTWRFDYDNYGNVTTIYLPTGGTISYQWTTVWLQSCGSDWGVQLRVVTSRTVFDGTTNRTWTYQPTQGSYVYGYTMTDPLGQQTVNTAAGGGACGPNTISQIQYYSANGSLLKTETRNYEDVPDPYRYITGGYDPLLPTGTTTIWPNNQQSQVSQTYDSGFSYCNVSTGLTASCGQTGVYGLVQQVTSSDYGSGAPGGTLSTKGKSYLALSNSNYLTANLLSLPASTIVYDGGGNKYSETDFHYDEVAPTTSSITTNHVSAPESVRGNLTSISQWEGGSSYLVSHQNVYDTGMLYQSIDVRGNTAETITYDPSFAGAYATKVCNALSQCSNNWFDWNTGLITSTQDPNGQSTTYSYDIMLRPISATYPDTAQDTAAYYPTSTNFSQAIVPGENLTNTKLFDGLGRLTQSQLTSDTKGTDFTDTAYDPLGRVASVLNPHRTTGNSTDGTSYYNYDAIGRVTQFIPQDGSSSANYVSTQYSGNETTVTDEVGNQKIFFNDGLGRLTRVDEPLGNPANGSATISGFDQVTGTPGTGTATVGGGPEQSCCSAAATQSNGWVTITGQDHCGYFQDPYGGDPTWECTDGSIGISVGSSFGAQVCHSAYTTGPDASCPKTASDVIWALVGQLNSSSSPVTAWASCCSANSGTIYMTSKQTGSATNYALSPWVYDNSDWSVVDGIDPYRFNQSGMAGGADAMPTLYDTGSLWVTVNGFQATANYDQNSSYNSLANAIANVFNTSSSSPVTASVASGSNVLNLTAKTNGAGTNYSLSANSSTSQPGNFSHPSFSMSVSGANLTGGSTAGLYDTGTVWVTVDGFQASATYGQGSTPSSLASSIANAFNASNSSPVAASASGSTVYLITRAGGSGTDYSLSAGSSTSLPGSFSQASFSASTSGSTLGGGVNGWTSTFYSYDPLGNLVSVNESGSRVRNFAYDPLSRLISVTNPESGTVVYHYDQDTNCPSPNSFAGQLVSKTDARGIRTCMQYDPLNRVTQKNYSDGVTPTATFAYDTCSGCPSGFSAGYSVGHLTEAVAANTRSFYGYDKRGRNASQFQCTPLNCGSNTYVGFNYTHTSLGGQTSISYNNAFTITQNYDSTNRVNQVTNSYTDQYNPSNLISVSQFWPTGQPNQLSFGNGLAEIRTYNSRLQPTQLRVYKTSGDVLNETFGWLNAQSQNNGNLMGWAASGTGTPVFNRTYIYDSVNRLSSMSSPADPSGCTGASWSYDDWGNRTAQTATGGSCGSSAPTFNTQNQISVTGYVYDAAGNLTAVPNPAGATYTYDAENRITQVVNNNGTASYVYDANGRRVEKVTSSAQTHYFYDEDGNVVMELNQSGAVVKDYIYSGGQHVAEISGGHTYFTHTDHLGSTRTVTDYAGNVCDSLDYMPYGEQIAGGSCSTHKFTGKERDETGLDNFGARYDSSQYGRFMTPDNGSAQDQANPQSWNLYSYVLNQPTTQTDADGHSVTICSDDEYENQHCQTVNDDAYKAAQQSDTYNKAPSLSSLQNSETGFGLITNASGAPVGTVQWTPDNPGIQTLGLAGSTAMSGLKSGVTQMALDAIGIGAAKLIGLGAETALAARTAGTVGQAGAGVEEILAKASSSMGNQTIKASSRMVAEEAAEKWVGAGARPIFREGEQVGFVSADGTKVARWTSAGKPDPYINLTNNQTAGNLHVHF